DVFLARVHQAVDVVKVFCQQRGDTLSDVPDAQREQDVFERTFLAIFDSRLKILNRLLLEARELRKLLVGQRVEISRIANKAQFEQLVYRRRAEPANIHRPATYEVVQAFEDLRGTFAIDAVGHRFAFFVDDRLPARGAFVRIAEDLFRAGALFEYRADDLRYHVAGAFDHDHVADADIFPANIVLIV